MFDSSSPVTGLMISAEAERKACEIRIIAERRAGQLLKKMEKAKGATEPGTNRGATPSPERRASPKPLSEVGQNLRFFAPRLDIG